MPFFAISGACETRVMLPICGAIELMGISDVLRLISAQKDKVSIFERFGYVEKDGAPIRVRTHQLRHYLNTLAQAGG